MLPKYNLKVKFNLKNSKIATLSSEYKPRVGDWIIFEKGDDIKYRGLVIDSYESERKQPWKVVEIEPRRLNKINSQVGQSILEGAISITNEVFEKYKSNTKKKDNLTNDQLQRRLARNVILSARAKDTSYKNTIRFDYGNMYIYVNLLNNTVSDIALGMPFHRGWDKNEKLYKVLNEKFGIV